MEPIQDVHVAEPGLLVVDVAAADDATAFAFQTALAGRRAIATADRTTTDPGQPGVRLRCYLDLRQGLSRAGRPWGSRRRPRRRRGQGGGVDADVADRRVGVLAVGAGGEFAADLDGTIFQTRSWGVSCAAGCHPVYDGDSAAAAAGRCLGPYVVSSGGWVASLSRAGHLRAASGGGWWCVSRGR
ncbi:DUF6207 family protein [Streptomyces sp. NBC_01615]|uniref:DUF6207 family protein n=1 Tax=Streptomyces sp. NBC_01615 TaxID=2975898 RepID=UPI0038671380